MPGTAHTKVVNELSRFRYIRKNPKYLLVCKEMLETKLIVNKLKVELGKHISGRPSNLTLPYVEKLLTKYESLYSNLLVMLERADNKAKLLKHPPKKPVKNVKSPPKSDNKQRSRINKVNPDELNGNTEFYESYFK